MNYQQQQNDSFINKISGSSNRINLLNNKSIVESIKSNQRVEDEHDNDDDDGDQDEEGRENETLAITLQYLEKKYTNIFTNLDDQFVSALERPIISPPIVPNYNGKQYFGRKNFNRTLDNRQMQRYDNGSRNERGQKRLNDSDNDHHDHHRGKNRDYHHQHHHHQKDDSSSRNFKYRRNE